MKDKTDSDRMFSIEQSLIASLLAFEGEAQEAVVGLYPTHFANKKLGDIYDANVALVKEGIALSPTSVGKRLRDRNHPDPDEVEQYLHDLWASSATAANAKWCADEIKAAWRLRASSEALNEASLALRCPGADFNEEIDRLHGRLDTIVKGSQSRGPRPLAADIENCYLKSREAAKTGKAAGVSTGYSNLDWWTSGLQPSNLIVLAARTGMGKTSLAMNVAANDARSADGVVVIFSMEMGRNELASRLVASEERLDLRRISSGELNDQQWARFEAAKKSLSPTAENIHLDVSGQITPTAIRAHLRRIQNRHNIALVIVDYLQLCGTTGKTESQYVRVSTISAALKAIAVDFDVPVLALSQLSREASRRGGEPRLSDLRDSGSIEQDANVVIFIHRDEPRNGPQDEAETASIIVAKNRNGPTGKFAMRWDPKSVRFSEYTDQKAPVGGGR